LDGDPHSIVEKDLVPHMKTLARTSSADVDMVDVADLEEIIPEVATADEPVEPAAKRARLSAVHAKRARIAPIRPEFGRVEQRRAEQTRAH
jgi:hypothetical protein